MSSFWQSLWGPSGLILLGAILGAIGALWSSQQRAGFEHELRIKSEQIAALNKDIASKVTGGDSYCYFSLAGNYEKDTALLVATVNGRYPLYDVEARLTDLKELEKCQDAPTFENLFKAITVFRIGNISPSSARAFFQTLPLGRTDKRDFNVFFTARNGSWVELMRFRFVNGKWLKAIRVQKNRDEGDPEILYEEIEDEYPRRTDGQVDWGN